MKTYFSSFKLFSLFFLGLFLKIIRQIWRIVKNKTLYIKFKTNSKHSKFSDRLLL